MILSNCTKRDINKALAHVNHRFAGNIMLNNYQQMSGSGLRHRVTLRVLDSHGEGAHISRHMEAYGHKARRTNSACWHVHGEFFDTLPHGTRITSLGKVVMAGDMWNDFSIGSVMFTIFASESCNCI